MFSLTEDELVKIAAWDAECNKRIIEKQKEEMSEADFFLLTGNGKHPYFGACGGNLQYTFTPTSIGVSVEVKNVYLNESLDITDYDSW